jgi:4-hydroxy-3-methylbut-2-enyl diphosphate reductase
MDILLANPRGFCAGVDRAITIVNRALELFGPPIYVRHEVVHNRYVVDDLARRGAVFVDQLCEVPDDSVVIFSAHGVSTEVAMEAKARKLQVFDATCPLVTKVHLEVAKYAEQNVNAVLIGHTGHPEVEGTMGRYHSDKGQIHLIENTDDVLKLNASLDEPLAYVTQTTLSMDDTAQIIDALRARFPKIEGPRKDDICYATQNRQDAVKILSARCDLMIVVGSPNSSNSNRLRELAERMGVNAHLIDDAKELKASWLDGCQTIGVTAGASAPEVLISEVISKLVDMGANPPQEFDGIPENVVFSIPKELKIPTTSL